MLLFAIQSCSEAGNEINAEILFAGNLIDADSRPNQIAEDINKNDVKVGLTVYADTTRAVTYRMLDSAGGRFKIEESTGVVFLADYLLLNAKIFPKHSITVQATFSDGSSQSETFIISVVPINRASFELSTRNNLIEVLSIVKSAKSEGIGIYTPHQYENNIPLVSKYRSLLNWNQGNKKIFDGWTWKDNIAYGNPGWLLDEEGPLGGGEKYSWGWGVRSFNKGDYGKKNTAIVDMNDRAPSSSRGGSLKVMETDDSTDHRSTWWIWYDGKPLSERGVTSAITDRMSFYLKTEGMDYIKGDGGLDSASTNFHIGTYLCWKTGTSSYGTGDGCPYEGPGNQHYYHYLGISSGAWIHVLLDQYPQHIRGKTRKLNNNPTLDKYNKNYFEQLSRFYFEIINQQNQMTNFKIDELLFYSTQESVESNQNEESISSLWVGYWQEKDMWEIGFHDKSHSVYNNENNSTFEVRWSTAPITNDNFYHAKLIEPLYYGGLTVAGAGGENLIRRANGWRSNIWTRFELPDEVENNYVKVFFAVKDVSKLGKHKGTKWPYNYSDGHDSPTSNVKIIDYFLKPSKQ
ncbi:cadherin repeat domain-containing protein [Colwellia sp. BRX8-9]|uniref:cadherin repeat domain-containing protein n=1 Tax=Colwellia sp. BRX8-9 TaxID=2759831 RepID=UPI0015F525C5|nr:cadherin repeat domain-containing protein [Colwellia sp. BRX8-9]MBA6348682.1 cadherin repeat domain-containing protein [Colwellia sp. BRX8-9]